MSKSKESSGNKNKAFHDDDNDKYYLSTESIYKKSSADRVWTNFMWVFWSTSAYVSPRYGLTDFATILDECASYEKTTGQMAVKSNYDPSKDSQFNRNLSYNEDDCYAVYTNATAQVRKVSHTVRDNGYIVAWHDSSDETKDYSLSDNTYSWSSSETKGTERYSVIYNTNPTQWHYDGYSGPTTTLSTGGGTAAQGFSSLKSVLPDSSSSYKTEFADKMLFGYVKDNLPKDYEGAWTAHGSGSVEVAVTDYSAGHNFLSLKKGICKIKVDTSNLVSGRRYQHFWKKRVLDENGTVLHEKTESDTFTYSGGIVETEEFEINPPEIEGSVEIEPVFPDFSITQIDFEENGVLSSGEKMKAWASIRVENSELTAAECLARIAWEVISVKPGMVMDAQAGSQGSITDGRSSALVAAGQDTGKVYVKAYDRETGVYLEKVLEIGCPCSSGNCGVGGVSVENECVELTLNLGLMGDGTSAGTLIVQEDKPTADLYTPYSLDYCGGDSNAVYILYGDEGELRQLMTPSVLADILVPDPLLISVTNSFVDTFEGSSVTNTYVFDQPCGYEIRLYQADLVAGKSNGVYSVDGLLPYKVIRVDDPDRLTQDYQKVRISEIMLGSGSSHTNTSTFTWDTNDQGWELSKGGNDEQIVKRGSVVDGDVRIETMLVTDGNNNDAAKTFSYYRTYFWGETLFKEVQDPDGATLVTDYTYYTDESDKERLGKPESVKYPDGSWVKYFYDDEGRRSSVWSPWLDLTLEQANASNCRRKDTSYEPVDATDLSQTNGYVILRPRLVTEYIEGTPVSKTAFAYYTNAVERIEKVVEYDDPVSGNYTATENQVSTSIYYLEDDADPDLADNMKRSESPNGLVATYGYVRGDFSFDNTLYSDGTFTFTADTNGAWLCETTTNGIATNPAGVDNKTTMSVSYRNDRGGVVLSETQVYTGGTSYERISWTANEYDYDDPTKTDATGHVVNRYYSDGTLVENTWSSCCGLERTINRQGQVEIYNYDGLGRRYSILRAGQGSQPDIDIDYGFDAAGRQVSMIETADGLSRTTGSDYDLAGRLQSSTNEAGLVTLYTYEDGDRTSTVEMPGGATQITETYIDGRTKRIYGTGTVEQNYEYGFESSDGTQWTKVYSGSQGINSSRWEKTITSSDGKTLKTERPGFGGTLLSTVYHYDGNDHLWKTEQLEGTTVNAANITEYDVLGNVVRSGLDVDKNNSLDLASMDRITDSDSNYWNDGTDWWRVGTSITYPKDGLATALQVSESKSRLTGFGGSGTYGILTSESINEDVFGNETVSQSWLDRETKTVTQIVDVPTSIENQISVSVNGQLLSVSSVNSVVQTYGYDGLGRRTTVVDPRIGTATTHFNDKGQVDWAEDTHGIRTGYAYYSDSGLRFSSSTTNGTEVATTYAAHDDRGQLKRQWGSATYPVAYDYDEFGQKTHMHTFRGGKDWDNAAWPGDSALADSTEWVYDPATGLLADKLYADGKGPSYTYWPNGKLKTRAWVRGITTTYSYYETGELQTTEYTDDTETISYTYNRMGQQATVVDAQGLHAFEYTGEGLLDVERLDDVEIIDRKYDSYGRSTGYDVDDASSFVGYGYDAYGRFSSIAATNGSDTSTIQYGYIPNSSLLSGHTAQAGGSAASLTVTKGFEPDRNLITGVTNQIIGGSNAGLVSSFTYQNDDLGRRIQRNDVRTAGVSPAQSHWQFDYNSRSELTNAVRNLPGAIPVAGQSTGYTYDNIGNRRLVSSSNDRKEIYTANALNQYVARTVPAYVDVMGTATNIATVTVRDAAHNDLPAPVIRQDDYFYKAYPVDNLTQAFDSSLEINAVINPAGTNDPDIVKTEVRSAFVPQTPEQFQYDDDGNLLSDGRFDYTWNGENRLITVSNQTGVVASYGYDYLGRRITKTVGAETTTFLWNGNHIIHEESSAKTNSYCWGQNDHLVSATLSGTNVFYAHDGNKNVTDLIDASGNAVGHYAFDPYGNINVKIGVLADANPFRFSNEYYDPETGHVAYMRRYYIPPIGCWLNRDPIGERGGEHLYGFTGNNPINGTDYLGLTWVGQILNEFFSPFGRERTWIMGESDRYTSIVRNWNPVLSEVDNAMASVSLNPKKWERSHMTTKSWRPESNERGDPARGYFSDLSHPPGTDPEDALREFKKYFLWLIQTDALHTSSIGSFRTHATVDKIDTVCKTATLNVWISNTMDTVSFGRDENGVPRTELWQFTLSAMRPQHMWWNWTQEFTFNGKGGFTLGTGDDW